jgi:hypothetical protein
MDRQGLGLFDRHGHKKDTMQRMQHGISLRDESDTPGGLQRSKIKANNKANK